jgi:hypothetical protein
MEAGLGRFGGVWRVRGRRSGRAAIKHRRGLAGIQAPGSSRHRTTIIVLSAWVVALAVAFIVTALTAADHKQRLAGAATLPTSSVQQPPTVTGLLTLPLPAAFPRAGTTSPPITRPAKQHPLRRAPAESAINSRSSQSSGFHASSGATASPAPRRASSVPVSAPETRTSAPAPAQRVVPPPPPPTPIQHGGGSSTSGSSGSGSGSGGSGGGSGGSGTISGGG